MSKGAQLIRYACFHPSLCIATGSAQHGSKEMLFLLVCTDGNAPRWWWQQAPHCKSMLRFCCPGYLWPRDIAVLKTFLWSWPHCPDRCTRLCGVHRSPMFSGGRKSFSVPKRACPAGGRTTACSAAKGELQADQTRKWILLKAWALKIVSLTLRMRRPLKSEKSWHFQWRENEAARAVPTHSDCTPSQPPSN